jgi:alpha-L-rhamnosidase
MRENDYSYANGGPVRVFKRTFHINQVTQTIIKIACLGCYQIKINNKLIDKSKLSPGWTDYNKTLYYKLYDITENLNVGVNEISLSLVDGWYSGYVGYGYKAKIPGISGVYGKHYWGMFPRFRLDLIEGDISINSNTEWKCQTSKVINSDILMGEFCDNRISNEIWDTVSVYSDISHRDEFPHTHPPIIEIRTIDANYLGGNIYDLGENIAGYVSLRVDGNCGDLVTVKHAETLLPNGSLDCRNLRTAKATDTYILGGGFENLEPQFTYHGFRYIYVDTKCDVLKVSGVVITTDIEYYDIELCDKNSNKLLQNIRRTQQSNFMDIPTDCPQRDERMGC